MINRQFTETWGLGREQFLGKTAAEVYPQAMSGGIMSRDQQVVESAKTLPFEEITHDGGALGVHTVWSTKVPLLDEDQRVTHIVTVELDVTQTLKAEHERRRWTQLLDDAIQSIPNGFAVYDASRRLVVCNAAFASLYGTSADNLVGLSAADIQRHAISLLRDGRHLHSIEEMTDEQRWRTRTEPQDVLARVEHALNAVSVSVTDTGPGIPEDVRARIFEPFFTTKEVGQGTGLGLAVSHSIVQAHGGTFEAGQTTESGTVFKVILPVGELGAVALPAQVEEHAGREAGRILIVDDAPDIAELLGEIVDGLGRHVEIAENGRIAMEKIATQEFDLIFCDIRMPDLDGPGLYAEIETHRPELLDRIVFVTGDALSDLAEQFLETTQVPVIEKPFMPDEVRELAAAMLSQCS